MVENRLANAAASALGNAGIGGGQQAITNQAIINYKPDYDPMAGVGEATGGGLLIGAASGGLHSRGKVDETAAKVPPTAEIPAPEVAPVEAPPAKPTQRQQQLQDQHDAMEKSRALLQDLPQNDATDKAMLDIDKKLENLQSELTLYDQPLKDLTGLADKYNAVLNDPHISDEVKTQVRSHLEQLQPVIEDRTPTEGNSNERPQTPADASQNNGEGNPPEPPNDVGGGATGGAGRDSGMHGADGNPDAPTGRSEPPVHPGTGDAEAQTGEGARALTPEAQAHYDSLNGIKPQDDISKRAQAAAQSNLDKENVKGVYDNLAKDLTPQAEDQARGFKQSTAPKNSDAEFARVALDHLAQDDKLFQQPKLEGKDLPELAKQIDPEFKVSRMGAQPSKGADRAWYVKTPDNKTAWIYENKGRVWLDVSRLNEGKSRGSDLYGIAAAYAHNTGRKFAGDPEGLSATAARRRTENMLSSALKFGTTEHLEPHEAQRRPEQYYGKDKPGADVRPLDWKLSRDSSADSLHNTRELLLSSADNTIKAVPEIADVRYDFDRREFTNSSGHAVGEADFKRIANTPAARGAKAGSSTLKRAALIHTLVREASSGSGDAGRPRRILEQIVRQLQERSLDKPLEDTFYSTSEKAPASQGLSVSAAKAAIADAMTKLYGAVRGGKLADRVEVRESGSGEGKQSVAPFDGSEVAKTPLAKDQTTITVDGVDRPAQNSKGQPIHWSEEGTRNFWRWFGGSKVVDEQGRPLVVYHGTNQDITKFSKDAKSLTQADSAKDGYWLTDGIKTAESYAHAASERLTAPEYAKAEKEYNALIVRARTAKDFARLEELANIFFSNDAKDPSGAQIYSLYVSMKNPVIIDAKSANYDEQSRPIYGAVEKALNNGNDGVIIKNLNDAIYSKTLDKTDEISNHFAVFNPEQIKSATGNRGSFDGSNPDIRQSIPKGMEPLKSGSVEGYFDPKTGKVVINADAIKPMFDKDGKQIMSADERAVWVAFHELGHRGLATRDGIAYRNTLTESGKNLIVSKIARAIAEERNKAGGGVLPVDRLTAVEEALMELSAGQETGRLDTILSRYGVRVSPAIEASVRGRLARFVEKMKGIIDRVLGRDTGATSDADVFKILRGIADARDGEIHPDHTGVTMNSMRTDTPVSLPDSIAAHPLGDATSHPDYAAAKSGDPVAAAKVARSLVTPDLVEKVRAAIGEEHPIIVPVAAEEASGRNKIPLAAAEILAKRLGLETSNDIVQSNSPKRTGMDGLDRIFSQPEFSGEVKKGQTYLLVDDTLTQGATFASLASHIESEGGKVIGSIALTGKQYSTKLKADPSTIDKVKSQYADIEPQFRKATGFGFDALTESEARYLSNYKPTESVRDRIIKAGNEAGEGSNSPTSRRGRERVTEAKANNETPPDGGVSASGDGVKQSIMPASKASEKIKEALSFKPLDEPLVTQAARVSKSAIADPKATAAGAANHLAVTSPNSELGLRIKTAVVDSLAPFIQMVRKAGVNENTLKSLSAIRRYASAAHDEQERVTYHHYLEPIQTIIGDVARREGLKSDEAHASASSYIYALHATEANRDLRAKGSTKPDPSGMSDETAAKIIAEAKASGLAKDWDKVDARLQALWKEKDRIDLASGRVTQAMINARTPFKHYATLRDDPNETGIDAFSPSKLGQENLQNRLGRSGSAGDPINNAYRSLDRSIMFKHEQKVREAL